MTKRKIYELDVLSSRDESFEKDDFITHTLILENSVFSSMISVASVGVIAYILREGGPKYWVKFIGKIPRILASLFNDILNFLTRVWNFVTGFFKKIMKFISKIWDFVKLVKNKVSDIWTKFKKWMKNVDIPKWMKKKWNNFTDSLSKLTKRAQKYIDDFSLFIDDIVSFSKKKLNNFNDLIFKKILPSINKKFSAAVKKGKKLIKYVIENNFITRAAKKAEDFGKAIVKGLYNLVTSYRKVSKSFRFYRMVSKKIGKLNTAKSIFKDALYNIRFRKKTLFKNLFKSSDDILNKNILKGMNEITAETKGGSKIMGFLKKMGGNLIGAGSFFNIIGEVVGTGIGTYIDYKTLKSEGYGGGESFRAALAANVAGGIAGNIASAGFYSAAAGQIVTGAGAPTGVGTVLTGTAIELSVDYATTEAMLKTFRETGVILNPFTFTINAGKKLSDKLFNFAWNAVEASKELILAFTNKFTDSFIRVAGFVTSLFGKIFPFVDIGLSVIKDKESDEIIENLIDGDEDGSEEDKKEDEDEKTIENSLTDFSETYPSYLMINYIDNRSGKSLPIKKSNNHLIKVYKQGVKYMEDYITSLQETLKELEDKLARKRERTIILGVSN